jgi:ribosomal protein S18 acetylase RimI-like enzyme
VGRACPPGEGIGSRLIEVVAARAAELGATSVSLWVADSNPGARRVYERLGFRTTGERGPLVSNPAIGQELLARTTTFGR